MIPIFLIGGPGDGKTYAINENNLVFYFKEIELVNLKIDDMIKSKEKIHKYFRPNKKAIGAFIDGS